MAERRSILGRLWQGVRNLFTGGGRQPPPVYRPWEPPPPTPSVFGFPEEEEVPPGGIDYIPEEPEPVESAYPVAGMVLVQGNTDYWDTLENWKRLVESNDAATLENQYGVTNIGIIRQLVAQGYWDDGLNSLDWQRFREEYARQFGFTTSKYSPRWGR